MHRRRTWYSAVPLLAAVLSTGAVVGQSRPATAANPAPIAPPTIAPATNAPATNVPGTLTGPGPVAPAAPRMFDEDPFARNAQQDFPSTEVRSAVDANARAAFARAQLYRTQHALDLAIADLTRVFETSADRKDALKAEQQAWEDYTTARNNAVRPLLNDAKYQANVSMKEQLGDKIVERRENKAGIHEIVILAYAKLDYAQVARDMEIVAIKNDSNVTDARAKLIAAGKRVSDVRAKFDDSIRTNADLIALRHGIEDARIMAITAEAYKAGAVEAANEALDYAYYKNRFTNLYQGSLYPYGYNSVYPVTTR